MLERQAGQTAAENGPLARPREHASKREHGAVWAAQGFGLVLLTFLSFFPRLFHLQEYFFFSLLAVAVGTAWVQGRSPWVRSPIDLPLLLFVSWVLLTVPFAADPAYSFEEWRKLAAQVLVFYWALLVLQMCPIMALSPKGGEGRVRGEFLGQSLTHGVLAAVILGTLVLCSYALIDFIARGGTWSDRVVRAGAPSSDYNWLSTYTVIALPLLVSAAVVFRDWWQRVAVWGTALLALPALVFSYTRAGWLALVAQGFAFALFTGRRRLMVGVFGVFIGIGLILLVLPQTGYQQSTLDPWTMNARLAVWKLGLNEMLSHPIVGLGYGNDTFAPVLESSPMGDNPMGLHSTFLMVGVGSGLPALTLLVWLLVKAVRSLLGRARGASDLASYALMVGTAIMIIGFAVRNLFDYMFAGSLAYLFWILVATALAQTTESRSSGQGSADRAQTPSSIRLSELSNFAPVTFLLKFHDRVQ